MGARARQAVRKAEAEMTKKDQLPARPVPASKRPVRVKLRRVNCDYHVAYAPESMKRDWWARLKKALGTASPDFVAATLRQIEIASRLPYQGTSEVAVNAVLAIIEGAQPRNEIEAVAAIQLACAHAAAMQVLNSLSNTTGRQQPVLAAVAAQLIKVTAVQTEQLRRLKGGQSQYVRVEHVHVNDGGPAVIGNVKTSGDRRSRG
jgi:hypothetical protein